MDGRIEARGRPSSSTRPGSRTRVVVYLELRRIPLHDPLLFSDEALIDAAPELHFCRYLLNWRKAPGASSADRRQQDARRADVGGVNCGSGRGEAIVERYDIIEACVRVRVG
jgi:hypothetical protein